jgi:ribonuclease HI
MHDISIYTDGACQPTNPGPGGYGVVILEGDSRREFSGGRRLTTNNRMEILAAVVGLEAIGHHQERNVTVYTDSRYVHDCIVKGWVRKWKKNHWLRVNGREIAKAKNVDLLDRLLELCDQHKARLVWVRGHNGNVENERCDELSVLAAVRPGLPADAGYEHKGD